jgi:hypothetical protein
MRAASTTTQFTVCGEFLWVVAKAANWRVLVRRLVSETAALSL